MDLLEKDRYLSRGLDERALAKLSLLGDRLLGAGFNVTALKDGPQIEKMHFLDSLSLLDVAAVRGAASIVDIGSGGGFPALVLALALPARIIAVESQEKKCRFIADCAKALDLVNVDVVCIRAEDYGGGQGREIHDVAVSRALSTLATVAEYSLPLVRLGGHMVAMMGAISDQERMRAQGAVGILGGGPLEVLRLHPFPGAENRWAYVAPKADVTPPAYPRRVGVPAKRPLGS